MGNPYFDRQNKAPVGRSGRKSETKLTKDLGGRARPASGAMEGAKGDIMLDRFLMEAKSTVANSISLKLDWLAKITREAMNNGKKPALSIRFTAENGDPVKDGDWVLIPAKIWNDHIK